MAIDTRERRASTTNFLLCNYGQGVTPQASFPTSERQAVLWTYAGIISSEAVEDAVVAMMAAWRKLKKRRAHWKSL